jgi:tRNA (mo5U34)-methyltransferase
MTLAEEVSALEWYHTLELAPGVVTPGWQDTRSIAAAVPFGSLDGLRCLDVGTFDGFWAFEMERRGAAEVVAIDILDPDGWDWPHGSDPAVKAEIGKRKALGRGFEIAREALGSAVDRRECSVYDLDPDVIGHFDLVYVGSLLLHLRDPVRALERVRSVCSGRLILVDSIDLLTSSLLPRRPVAVLDGRGRPWWWNPNEAGLERFVESAGFDVVDGPRRIYIPSGVGRPLPNWNPKYLLTPEGRAALVAKRRGDPHAVIVATPRRDTSAGTPAPAAARTSDRR